MDTILNTVLLYKAGLCVSKEEERHYLRGVYIYDADGKRFYAGTNGHMLVECHHEIDGDSAPLDEPIILVLSNDFMKDHKKGNNINLAKYRQYNDKWALLDSSTGEMYTARLLEGPFPDYKRMMFESKHKASSYTVFNQKYLKVLGMIDSAFPMHIPYVQHEGETDCPCLWKNDNVTVMLMPIRAD